MVDFNLQEESQSLISDPAAYSFDAENEIDQGNLDSLLDGLFALS